MCALQCLMEIPGYVHGLIHMGLGMEFKQPLTLAEGLAQSAVHRDMWYTEYLQAAEQQAIKAEEPALPLSVLIDMMRLDYKIRNCSSVHFHRQTRPYSGRWAMDQEPARDGVLRNAKAELLRLAARYRVSPPSLKQAVAELQNAAGESFHSSNHLGIPSVLTNSTSLPHSRRPKAATRMCLRLFPATHHNYFHQCYHFC